jgi:hypothetical protein
MLAQALDPEDIKATLRKRHGTVLAFAQTRGLKYQGVRDFLRGRPSAAVATAIEAELQAAHVEAVNQSTKVDNNGDRSSAHPINVLNAGGR